MERYESENLNTFYARIFVEDFSEAFAQAEVDEMNSFPLSTEDFDRFVIRHGFTDAYTKDKVTGNMAMPSKLTNQILWNQLRKDSNYIRTQLNDVSTYGGHGEPPYRIDAKNGSTMLRVRLTSDIVALTGSEMLSAIETTLSSKKKHLFKHTNKWTDNIELLPHDLQISVKLLNKSLNKGLSRAVREVNEAMDECNDLGEEIRTHFNDIGEENPMLLESLE